MTSRTDDGFDLLNALMSAAPVGLAVTDLNLRFVRANDAFAVLSGHPLSQILERTLKETSSPAVWSQIEPLARRAIEKGQATYDHIVVEDNADAAGRRYWRVSYFPLRARGRVIAVGISIAGVRTPVETSESAGGRNEEVHEIQYTLDIDRQSRPLPDRVLDLLGIERAEFSAGDDAFLNALYPADDTDADTGRLFDESGQASDPDNRPAGADTSVRWVHERAEVQLGSSGQQTLVGTVQHITERNEIEERLHQMQSELLHVSRLSAMGQVSSTLAHEVNQPLTAVGNYIRAGLLMLEAGDQIAPAKIRGVFEKAAQQAARASAIIRNLREFVRKGDAVRRPENLTIVVQEAMALARLGTKDRGLKVRLQLDGDSRWASVNRVQIQQVLVNLIRNAIEAMADNPQREIVVSTASGGRDMIEVSVADSGPGLSEDIARDLFKPFMTTKPEGMGVGLAICHSIIDAHGGRIWAEANPSGGTIFHFTLPRSEIARPSGGNVDQ